MAESRSSASACQALFFRLECAHSGTVQLLRRRFGLEMQSEEQVCVTSSKDPARTVVLVGGLAGHLHVSMTGSLCYTWPSRW